MSFSDFLSNLTALLTTTLTQLVARLCPESTMMITFMFKKLYPFGSFWPKGSRKVNAKVQFFDPQKVINHYYPAWSLNSLILQNKNEFWSEWIQVQSEIHCNHSIIFQLKVSREAEMQQLAAACTICIYVNPIYLYTDFQKSHRLH